MRRQRGPSSPGGRRASIRRPIASAVGVVRTRGSSRERTYQRCGVGATNSRPSSAKWAFNAPVKFARLAGGKQCMAPVREQQLVALDAEVTRFRPQPEGVARVDPLARQAQRREREIGAGSDAETWRPASARARRRGGPAPSSAREQRLERGQREPAIESGARGMKQIRNSAGGSSSPPCAAQHDRHRHMIHVDDVSK